MDRPDAGFDKLDAMAVQMRRLIGLGMLSAATVATAAQQVDVSSLGPQVGERVTDFRLVDQQGRTQSIAGAAGPKGTMVVFFRSADW
jgi:hypothetical protein